MKPVRVAFLLLVLIFVAPVKAGVIDDVKAAVQAEQAKNYSGAIALYSKVLNVSGLSPDDMAIVVTRRGNVYGLVNDNDRAIADFTEAIRFNPRMDAAFNNRANMWYRKKEFDRAIADYTDAIRIKPTVDALRNRGDSWQNKQDYERAIVDYDRALRLDPSDAGTLNNREGAVSRRDVAKNAAPATAQKVDCKANEAMIAKLRAMGATNIQIEGCTDVMPAKSAGLQLPPPDMSKPLPFEESPENYTAGLKALVTGQFEAAAKAYHAGATVGDPGCALELSVMYEYGQGVPKDRKLADAWLEKSIEDERMLAPRALRHNFATYLDLAERGYRAGQYAAGVAYAENNDGKQPTGRLAGARLWLGKAAALGHVRAATLLKNLDAPVQTAGASAGVYKYVESDYIKKAAAARKSQNAANCERAAKGARVYCEQWTR